MQSCILILKMYMRMPDHYKAVAENTSEAKAVRTLIVKWDASGTRLRAGFLLAEDGLPALELKNEDKPY